LRSDEIKSFRIGDAFIILLLALGTALSFISRGGSGKGETVMLLEGNAEAQSYSLAKDTVLTVDGPIGKTEVEIRKGQVWIASASCPQQICRHQGKIRSNGQILVCIPNRLVVEVKGSRDPEVDATTE
jgi:hypothetical protein